MTAVDPSGMAQIVDIGNWFPLPGYGHTCIVFSRPCLRGDDNKLYNSIGAFPESGKCCGFYQKGGGEVHVPDTRYNPKGKAVPRITDNDVVFEHFLRACAEKHRSWKWNLINNCQDYAWHLWDCAFAAKLQYRMCVRERLRAGYDSLVPCIKYAKDSIRCH